MGYCNLVVLVRKRAIGVYVFVVILNSPVGYLASSVTMVNRLHVLYLFTLQEIGVFLFECNIMTYSFLWNYFLL